jgi:hypothetical protein
MTKKQQIIAALRAFIGQRPGLEFFNYGDVTGYRAEMRAITKDLHHARQLLRDVELRDSITAEMIVEASKHAYSGRLSIVERADGAISIDYCAGQYWPTEYRKAVCAVCASLLWDYTRTNYGAGFAQSAGRPITGSELRAQFRREYGRGIASRWFD